MTDLSLEIHSCFKEKTTAVKDVEMFHAMQARHAIRSYAERVPLLHYQHFVIFQFNFK